MKHTAWILWLLLVCSSSYAQQAKVAMTGTPKGIYIDVNDLEMAKQGYLVLRKGAGDKEFLPIQHISALQSLETVRQRIKDLLFIFPESGNLSDSLSQGLWQAWEDPLKQQQYLTLQIPQIRIGFGLGLMDTTAVLGQNYSYKIIATDGSEYNATMTYNLPKVDFAAIKSIEVDPGEAYPILRFQSAITQAAPLFEIYRRVRGSGSDFRPVYSTRGLSGNSQNDSVIYYLQDTTALQSVRYEYYLIGKDLFGNQGTSSDTVTLQVGGFRNINRGFNVRTAAIDGGIKIYWEPLEQRYALQNILLYRSDNYDTNYRLLATVPVTDTLYVDQSVRAGKNYYYQLLMQGESAISFPTARVSGIATGIVNILPPTQVHAYMKGNLPTLEWQHVDSLNVAGFYIYRSFDANGELRQVSNFIPYQTKEQFYHYQDSSATIGDVISYYAIAAVSHTQSLSPLSEVVKLSIPKGQQVEIASPKQLRYLWMDKEKVSITWYDMDKIVNGVNYYNVYRKSKDEPAFPTSVFAKVETNEFVDTLRRAGVYDYAVQVVIDSTKTSALSSPIQVERILEKPLAPLKVRLYAVDDTRLLIQWDHSATAMKAYNIYRSSGKADPQLLKTILGDQFEYVDTELIKGNSYYYFVTSIDTNSIESDRSQEVFYSE
ncbi:hypothetical protein [Sphingobacterium athyrii]|nr:hypothetical protein [Sphingobacterium athyrii]